MRPMARILSFLPMVLGFHAVTAMAAMIVPGDPAKSESAAMTPVAASNDALLAEGKALYEDRQYIAALGKFMMVLRSDPHDPEARRYLRMVIDVMRQNPATFTSKPGAEG